MAKDGKVERLRQSGVRPWATEPRKKGHRLRPKITVRLAEGPKAALPRQLIQTVMLALVR